jgi:photosystem II stability/assembly factor-like uncharacterized protein
MQLRRLFLALGLVTALASPLRAGDNVWTPLGPEGGIVWQVAPDPGAPGTLYAAADGGVFKSTDGGATWALSSRGLSDFPVYALVVDPHQVGHLFAIVASEGLTYGIYRSTDGGATWQAADNAPDGFASALAIDPQNSATVYAGTFAGGFWRSTDAGKSWQKRSYPFSLFDSVIADPLHSGTVYAGSGDSVAFAKSTDGGATWVNESGALPSQRSGRSVIQIALDPESPTILYAAVANRHGKPDQLFRSRDDGAHWLPVAAAGPGGSGGEARLPLATGPGGAVYAGAVRSLDHGRTFTPVTLAPGGPVRLNVAPTSSITVYAASSDGAFKSTDGALTWQRIVHGLTGTAITAVGVPPTGLPVYAGVHGLGIVRSRPSGHGWVLLDSDPLLTPVRFVFDTKDSALVYAQVPDGVIRTTDDGQDWQALALPAPPKNCGPSGILAFDVAPAAPGKAEGVLYAGVKIPGDQACKSYCTAYKSLDRGNTWTCLALPATGLSSFAVAPGTPSIVYASEGQRLWKSVDAGATWSRIDRNLQRLANGWDLAAVDPTNAQILYLISTAGLLKSSDGGLTWVPINQGLPTSFLRSVVIDPTTPTTLWAGDAFSGVYRSLDGGLHWHPENGGLRGFSGSLALDPEHPETLYASTPSNGVYTLTVVP